jgi:hypothetical protein
VLAYPELRAVIDPARPVAVIAGAVLHFLDAGAARRVTAGTWRAWLPEPVPCRGVGHVLAGVGAPPRLTGGPGLP